MGGIDARPPTNTNPTTQNDRQEKGTTNMKNPKLSDALKGMKVKSWEVRQHSSGRRVVYVRFTEIAAPTTVKVA